MFSRKTLDAVDPSGMYKVYDKWPEMAKTSFNANFQKLTMKNIDHVVFAGMGGSGSIGDIFKSLLSKTNLTVTVVKGYELPNNINSRTLIVVTTDSGNTAEALSVLFKAKKQKHKVIGFSSGGEMETFCKKNNVSYRKIDHVHSPRASLPYYVYSILNVLEPILKVKTDVVLDSIKQLSKMRKKISSKNITASNTAINLAKWITDIPIMYCAFGMQDVAIRFRNSLAENSKTHSIVEDVLETCHNGMIAWEEPTKVKPILIKGKDDHPKSKERFGILKEYFKQNRIDYKEVISPNGNILSKMMTLMYFLDYVSIYMAILRKVDPTIVTPVNFIKSKHQKSHMR